MSYDKKIFLLKFYEANPCDKIYEDEYVLAFKDIRPQAPSCINNTKGRVCDINDFSKNATMRK